MHIFLYHLSFHRIFPTLSNMLNHSISCFSLKYIKFKRFMTSVLVSTRKDVSTSGAKADFDWQHIEYLYASIYKAAHSSWRSHDKSGWNLFRTSARGEVADSRIVKRINRGGDPSFLLTKRSLPVDVAVVQVNGRYPCVGCCRGFPLRILRNGALARWR